LHPQQAKALKLILGGRFHYHPPSGGARSADHDDGDPVINDRVLAWLLGQQYVVKDTRFEGRLLPTEQGRAALKRYRESRL
jgi:hypothetical protein